MPPAPASSTSFGTTREFGQVVGVGRSLISSLIFATASSAASAFLASGDSAAAILPAASQRPPPSGRHRLLRLGGSRRLLPGALAVGRCLLRRISREAPPAAAPPPPPGVPGLGRLARAVGAALRRRRRRRRVRAAGERALEVDRGQAHPAQHLANRARHVVEVRQDVLAELVDADAHHGGGHHHAGQAGLRFAGRASSSPRRRRSTSRPHSSTRPCGTLAPGRAGTSTERRVAEQALDQLRRDVRFGRRHLILAHPIDERLPEDDEDRDEEGDPERR